MEGERGRGQGEEVVRRLMVRILQTSCPRFSRGTCTGAGLSKWSRVVEGKYTSESKVPVLSYRDEVSILVLHIFGSFVRRPGSPGPHPSLDAPIAFLSGLYPSVCHPRLEGLKIRRHFLHRHTCHCSWISNVQCHPAPALAYVRLPGQLCWRVESITEESVEDWRCMWSINSNTKY